MIAEHTLEAIRDRTDIVELIGQYVELKRTGQGYAGLCPFHKEKTPSFHVQPQKQIFHCFGCHKGGNAFTFLVQIEGLRFPDAVRKLAERAGVPLEESPQAARERTAQVTPGHERLYEVLEWAAKFFHYLLFEKAEYRPALDYARGRGLSDETLKKFRVGVSPKGWSTLLDNLLKRGFRFEEILAAGLVVPKEDAPGKAPTTGYDRFRERLMFPILDAEGKVVAFGARILQEAPGQPTAKYLNSPESPLFSKRRMLYGIYENQRGIRLRQEAVLVEGYMDVVGLAEKGVDNAMATMGTALTEEHCAVLKKITKRVVTVFDADRAGQDAWHRSVHLFLTSGIFAKDLTLPEGKDPDEYVLAHGSEAFYALCTAAPRQVTKLLKEVASRGALSEADRAQYLERFTPILVASRSLPDRALLWDDLSLLLQVSVDSLRAVTESAVQRMQARVNPAATATVQTGSVPQKRKMPGPLTPVKPRPPKRDALSMAFFQAALRAPLKFLRLPREQWADCLTEPSLKAWLETLAGSADETAMRSTLGALAQTTEESDLLALLTGAALREGKPTKEDEEFFDAVTSRLQGRRRETAVRALTLQAKLADKIGGSDEGLRLLEQARTLRNTGRIEE